MCVCPAHTVCTNRNAIYLSVCLKRRKCEIKKNDKKSLQNKMWNTRNRLFQARVEYNLKLHCLPCARNTERAALMRATPTAIVCYWQRGCFHQGNWTQKYFLAEQEGEKKHRKKNNLSNQIGINWWNEQTQYGWHREKEHLFVWQRITDKVALNIHSAE